MSKRPVFLLTCFCFGFAFLYIPILSMIFFSFNRSRLASVWGGFSTQWYGKLFNNDQVINAAVLSIEIALVSATIATILGTMAAIALVRIRRFRGKMLLSGFVSAPLIMPDVITGISLLILFLLMGKWIGWPSSRGFTTVTLAHITFSMTYVATVVQSRLLSTDVSVEEAALDLGARPFQVLTDVTLPIIWPAIVSGWLLAFTLSLDDVIISSFTTGPGATTLPILLWSRVRLGVSPDINALGTIIILVVSAAVLIAGFIMMHGEKRRERDVRQANNVNQ